MRRGVLEEDVMVNSGIEGGVTLVGRVSSHIAAAASALWIETHFPPAVALAGEDHAVVQAEGLVLPELDRDRRDAEARPVGRARHVADGIFGRVDRHRLFQREAAFQRARLLARPGADAAVAGAALEIGVRLGVADRVTTGPRARTWRRRLFQCSTMAAFGWPSNSRPLFDSVLV